MNSSNSVELVTLSIIVSMSINFSFFNQFLIHSRTQLTPRLLNLLIMISISSSFANSLHIPTNRNFSFKRRLLFPHHEFLSSPKARNDWKLTTIRCTFYNIFLIIRTRRKKMRERERESERRKRERERVVLMLSVMFKHRLVSDV